MPNDWVPRDIPTLLIAIDKFTAALNNAGGQAASGLAAAQFTALTAARADLQTALTDRTNKEAAFRAAVDVQTAKQTAAETQLRALGRAANNALSMTDALRATAGLTVRDKKPSPGSLPLVQDLVVIGRPNGNNFLDWTGETGGSLRYQIYSRLNTPAAEWTLIGAASSTDFCTETRARECRERTALSVSAASAKANPATKRRFISSPSDVSQEEAPDSCPP